jgi:hypothetical protein
MISEHCDLEAFFSEINGKRKGEAILMAHQEATAAERMLLSNKGGAVEKASDPPIYSEYSSSLKEFIQYIRCTIRPKPADDVKHRMFQTYLDSREPYISVFQQQED